MKLHYFPRIYPDELLYSVLARYQKHVGEPPQTLSNLELLGKGYAVPSLDMQNGIRNLTSSISSTTQMSDDRVLDELTLFNYLVAYVDRRLANKVRSAVLAGNVSDWYIRLGYAAFKVNRLTTLRFCMLCRARMLNDFGELYWRRAHQLSSVLVCREHQQSLYLSQVDIQPISRHSFIAADTDNNPIDARPIISTCSEKSLSILVEIAKMSESLLDTSTQKKTLGGWTSHYRRQLEDAGLVSVNGRISMKRLHNDISLFYHGLDNQILGSKTNPSLSWVSKLARKQRSLTHPLHHLLFQCYLNRTPHQYKPFGLGPWPCRNPLANHFGNAVIRSFETHTNHGHQVAVFKCKCGYVYTRWFLPHTGQIGPVRFQAYGPTLEPAIRAAMQKEISLRALARELQLDPKTVVRLASNLGIAVSWKTGTYLKKNPRQEISPTKRTVITDNRSKKALRKLDWNTIDINLRSNVKVAVRAIKKETPPIKLTIAEIERRVKRTGWITKRLMKLPLTSAYLDQILETHSTYRERRIDWAINELISAGKPLFKSNVIRTSGLRSDANLLVEKALVPWLEIRSKN